MKYYNFINYFIMQPFRVIEQLGLLQKHQKNGIQLQNKQMWKNINKEKWNNGKRANVHRKNRIKYR